MKIITDSKGIKHFMFLLTESTSGEMQALLCKAIAGDVIDRLIGVSGHVGVEWVEIQDGVVEVWGNEKYYKKRIAILEVNHT